MTTTTRDLPTLQLLELFEGLGLTSDQRLGVLSFLRLRVFIGRQQRHLVIGFLIAFSVFLILFQIDATALASDGAVVLGTALFAISVVMMIASAAAFALLELRMRLYGTLLDHLGLSTRVHSQVRLLAWKFHFSAISGDPPPRWAIDPVLIE